MFLQPEKALLVGIELPQPKQIPLDESLEELRRLADTARAVVVGQIRQKRQKPDQKYFIGSGKLEELKTQLNATQADLVIFDVDLSPAQARNLEAALATKVIDRTELILDIFAQHARSREGQLQVELAQASFRLTRLTGHGAMMSRLGGGIGTRGPGETKLEVDRRRIRKRISDLNKEIDRVRQERNYRREKRRKSQLPVAAIVGYTNAGKSTLLNSLTNAGVLAQDQLFATLDTTMRRWPIGQQRTVLLTDTVGFIQKLPHQLIAAFRATLEEVTEADILLHIVDAAHPFYIDQIAAVYTVLEDLKCVTKPIITIFNKIDLLNKQIPREILNRYQPAIAVSAMTRTGLDQLAKILTKILFPQP